MQSKHFLNAPAMFKDSNCSKPWTPSDPLKDQSELYLKNGSDPCSPISFFTAAPPGTFMHILPSSGDAGNNYPGAVLIPDSATSRICTSLRAQDLVGGDFAWCGPKDSTYGDFYNSLRSSLAQ